MARFRTPAAIAAVLVSAAVAVAHAAPGWTAAAGLDFWNLPGLEAERRAAYAEHAQLEDRHQVLMDSCRASDLVVESLIDGRLPLADAVAELESINRDRPGFYEALEMYAPEGAAGRERLAWYALNKARARLRGDPTRAAEVLPRLTADYRALFLRDPTSPPAVPGVR